MRMLSRKTLAMMGSAALALLWGCGPISEQDAALEDTTGGQQVSTMESLLTAAQKRTRCDAVKSITGPRGITNPLVYAGIANHETGLAQCWSEATWACQGPYSSDCGGPVIAGSGDGACSLKQGGLGMYQLDSGTHSQTLAAHGNGILNIGGNIQAGVNVIINKVRVCPNTRDMFTTDAQAIAWINSARPGTSAFETFLTTMAWCYNGCTPTGCSNHNTMREKYRTATQELRNLFGDAYWYSSCSVGGAILTRYNQLGGAGGFLGSCVTSELTTPDTIGRYNHFQNGSIYWTQATGAWEVWGNIRIKWEQLGWEKSALGYPITGENATPDTIGRYNHFQGGSIYWTPDTGAHEVRGNIHAKWKALGWETSPLGYPTTDEMTTPDGVGRYNHFRKGATEGSIYWTQATGAWAVYGQIRNKWAELGWENSALGYPVSDEYAVAAGRESEFQKGFITYNASTGALTVRMK